MGKIAWILGVAFVGAAAYVLLSGSSYAPAGDGVDEFGAQVGNWGTRKRAGGAGGVLGGKLKQGVGKLAGRPDVESEGAVDEAAGRVKNAAGKAAQAVSDTISGLKD